EAWRPRLRAHADGGVAGKRLHDRRPSSCPGCASCPAAHPPATPTAGQLRLARASPPPGSPLRPRRATRQPTPAPHPRLRHMHRPHPEPPHTPTLAHRTTLAQPTALTPLP